MVGVRKGFILGCFKEVGFNCIIDSEIIIENDSDLAVLLRENDQIEANINFDKDLEICNRISENWKSEILDNFVERSAQFTKEKEWMVLKTTYLLKFYKLLKYLNAQKL